MPKELEKALAKQADKLKLKGNRKNAYIYGTLRKTGWKPSHQKESIQHEAQELVNKLVGGVGDHTKPHEVDPTELQIGISIEMEHTDDPEIAKEIALDHLSENPAYYSELEASGIEADQKASAAEPDIQQESKDLVTKILHEAPTVVDFDSRGNPKEYKELPGEDLGKYDANALTKFSKKAEPEYKKKLQAEIEKRSSGSIAYRDLPERLKDGIRGKVTEHEDGSISVDGHVFWDDWNLVFIPIKFRRVTGDFWCRDNKLISLENAPDWVGEDFDCDGNRLTSLKGAPNQVGDVFSCARNQLTSLEGAPSRVGRNFDCHRNKLTSLKHAPGYIGGYVQCTENKLTSLDGLGEVKGSIKCMNNPVPTEQLIAEYRRKRAKKELVGEAFLKFDADPTEEAVYQLQDAIDAAGFGSVDSFLISNSEFITDLAGEIEDEMSEIFEPVGEPEIDLATLVRISHATSALGVLHLAPKTTEQITLAVRQSLAKADLVQ